MTLEASLSRLVSCGAVRPLRARVSPRRVAPAPTERTHRLGGAQPATTRRTPAIALVAAAIALLAGSSARASSDAGLTSNVHGTLLVNPPVSKGTLRTLSFALQLAEQLPELLLLSGVPACDLNIRYLQYTTLGGAGEASTASGVMMLPSGSHPGCAGPRPILLYAHGTSTDSRFNLAALLDAAANNPARTEATLIAAMYAAHGYIVIAPNYAGYDSSTLAYHPYLNAVQQSGEMIDVYRAASSALPELGIATNGKLFVTGYSEGGYVAMATERAMQQQGIPLTAAAPMSGPYAMAAFVDAIYAGQVNLGASIYSPLLTTSYQKAYGDVYNTPADLYQAPYAGSAETFLTNRPASWPSALFNGNPTSPILAGISPPSQPAQFAPVFALGFGASGNYLVNDSARVAYLMDALINPDGAFPTYTSGLPASASADPLRRALLRNDLRGWTPSMPTLLCAGNGDPTVFYVPNTAVMARLWASDPHVTVLDVGSPPKGSGDPYAALKLGFDAAMAAIIASSGQTVATEAYHGAVAPFCAAAARHFFGTF